MASRRDSQSTATSSSDSRAVTRDLEATEFAEPGEQLAGSRHALDRIVVVEQARVGGVAEHGGLRGVEDHEGEVVDVPHEHAVRGARSRPDIDPLDERPSGRSPDQSVLRRSSSPCLQLAVHA